MVGPMPSPGFRCVLRSVIGVSLFTTLGSPAAGQDRTVADAPAHVTYVEGSATLERDGQVDAVTVNMPIVAGDRLVTSSGRIEILFPDLSVLDVDLESTVDVLSPTLIGIPDGRSMLTVAGAGDPSRAIRYGVDTPAASVETDGPGEYRITVVIDPRDETQLSVLRGFAHFTNEHGSSTLRAGELSVASDDGAPMRSQEFNTTQYDPFDRWIAERRNARAVLAPSQRYLSGNLQAYGGMLDRAGSWRNEPTYGNVWYPTVVADWRPYYNGYWSPVPSFGWTWIGAEVWAWPTHHYGRWGHSARGWFW